ncbi:hypothetical protein [Novosphingobium sp.]|uniref:hypothetical protein n=1 Tax=Novosphingobium sp. TaxID=1874826 RepID=UPI00333F04C6
MTPDPALPRFMILQALRLSGALIALLGVVILSHGQRWLAGVPDLVGAVLVVAGAAEFFAVPMLLARAWKRRP